MAWIGLGFAGLDWAELVRLDWGLGWIVLGQAAIAGVLVGWLAGLECGWSGWLIAWLAGWLGLAGLGWALL